nr:putative ribonuclease H-like domain-containing protein [Tanacetum cinerariifolium]
QDDTKKALEQEYILMPICTTGPLISQGTKDNAVDAGKKAPKVHESEALDNGGKNDQVPRSEVESLFQQERQTENINCTNSVNTVGSSFVNDASQTPINADGPSARKVDMNNVDSSYTIPEATKDNLGKFEGKADEGYFIGYSVVSKAMRVFNKRTRIVKLFIQRHKDDILLVQVYVDDIIFGSTKKELSTEFEKLMHDKFQISSMGELFFFLGLQVKQRSDGIFISQDKYVAEVLKKFDFVNVKTASTLIESDKPLIKDEKAEDVDVYLYRSMIGSLMYLTASRPDITFDMCACARFQVNLKTSRLHAMKRIFRYLKGQPKLGLWYPKDSPLDLEAYFDSDYAGASLDRISTTEGCQFLGKRLISWQCKKQTIVANSTTEAEYVAATNYYGQVIWIQNQMLDYGFNLMSTKIYIDNKSTICIVKNPVFHFKTKHIEIQHHFIRDSYEKKLIQVIKIHTDENVADPLTKAFDVSRLILILMGKAKQLITDAIVLLNSFQAVVLALRHCKMRKEAETSPDESEDEDHVPTPSSDPLPSGDDNSILNELMVFCTSLQEQVFDLQEAKDAQVKEIVALKKKVTRLTKWRKSRSEGLRRLKRIGSGRRVKSPMEKDVIDSAAPITDVTKDEITIAQALAVLKSVKPKVVVQEQEMSTTIPAAAIKDKGKAKMIKPEVPLKKKDQMRIDEEYDNIQAMMDADRLLTERLQAREKEEFSKVQKARLLVELIEKRNKHFTALRAQEKRRKPPIKTQMKSQMPTYLRHMGGYKQSHLKGMSFDEIKELFNREMKKVNDFVAMDLEVQKKHKKAVLKEQQNILNLTFPRNKRMFKNFNREDLKVLWAIVKDRFKKEKPVDDMDNILFITLKTMFDHHVEDTIWKYQQGLAKVDENVIDDTEELKKCMEIVPDDGDEVLIEATPISSRSSTIIDYKIHKEGKKTYFKIIRADVKDRFKKEKPVDDMDNLLFRILKTMFEHNVEDVIWTYQQGLANVKNWKLYESCRVYCITMQSIIYYLLVKKVYPLIRNTLHQL